MKYTEKQYRDHKELRIELEKMLESPALKHALEIVEELAKPRRLPEPRPNVHFDTLTSQQYYRLLGIQSAVDKLKKLTTENAPEEKEEDELSSQPYFNTLPKEMQDALRKQVQEAIANH